MEIKYPNGSYEVWSEIPKMLIYIKAVNPFGSMWVMSMEHGVHNQRTGNPDAKGIHRRGRKWYLHFDNAIGWEWR